MNNSFFNQNINKSDNNKYNSGKNQNSNAKKSINNHTRYEDIIN